MAVRIAIGRPVRGVAWSKHAFQTLARQIQYRICSVVDFFSCYHSCNAFGGKVKAIDTSPCTPLVKFKPFMHYRAVPEERVLTNTLTAET